MVFLLDSLCWFTQSPLHLFSLWEDWKVQLYFPDSFDARIWYWWTHEIFGMQEWAESVCVKVLEGAAAKKGHGNMMFLQQPASIHYTDFRIMKALVAQNNWEALVAEMPVLTPYFQHSSGEVASSSQPVSIIQTPEYWEVVLAEMPILTPYFQYSSSVVASERIALLLQSVMFEV